MQLATDAVNVFLFQLQPSRTPSSRPGIDLPVFANDMSVVYWE